MSERDPVTHPMIGDRLAKPGKQFIVHSTMYIDGDLQAVGVEVLPTRGIKMWSAFVWQTDMASAEIIKRGDDNA